MPIPEYTKRAIKKYDSENYEYIKLRLYKGEADVLRGRAKAEGLSLNQYLRNLVFGQEEIDRLNSKAEEQ